MVTILFKDDVIKQKKLIHDTILNGGIIIYPTDTLYGIGGRADNDEVVEKVYEIKNRDKDKPLSVIVPNFNYLFNNFNITQENQKNIRNKLPGAYSFIVECNNESNLLSKKLNLSNNTLSIRICNHYIQDIVFSLGVPIISTSANFSGEKSPATFNDISAEMIKKVDIIIIDDTGVLGSRNKIIES